MFFDFAFQNKGATKSTEDMVVIPAGDRSNTMGIPGDEEVVESMVSSDAEHMIRSSAMCGIISAFARKMAIAGVPKEDIDERIADLVASAQNAGDIEKSVASWIKGSDYYDSVSNVLPVSYRDSFSMFQFEDDIIEEALCTRTWLTCWSQSDKQRLTDNERAILDNYEVARKAYYEARNLRHEYFFKKSKAIVHDLLVKYTEILSKLDPELYAYLADRVDGKSLAAQCDPESTPAN